MFDIRNKRVLVLGLGISGKSAVSLLLQQGAIVHGLDDKAAAILENAEIQELCKKGLKIVLQGSFFVTDYDLILVSPGISPAHQIYKTAFDQDIPIIGEVELACRFLKPKKFLGITGTNGKTTVTLLVTHILNNSGISAIALGNMGVPMTSYCHAGDDEVFVVELSSFQLDTMHTPMIDAAVVLNITPDHLDRYGTMEAYARSKLHIADCLKQDGILYLEENCAKQYETLLEGMKYKTYGYQEASTIYSDQRHLFANKKIRSVLPSLLQNRKSHDLENIMAAYALCSEVGVSSEQFFQALHTFKKPSHRIEFVRELQGVSFYDDSKGTNLDAVIRAVDSLQGTTVLIAGGVDKGAAYTPWIKAFGNKVKCICTIGQASSKIKQDLAHAIPIEHFDSMEKAVAFAASLAKSGENVLLSPGCSSYDMFRDYAHRGQVFQHAVRQL